MSSRTFGEGAHRLIIATRYDVVDIAAMPHADAMPVIAAMLLMLICFFSKMLLPPCHLRHAIQRSADVTPHIQRHGGVGSQRVRIIVIRAFFRRYYAADAAATPIRHHAAAFTYAFDVFAAAIRRRLPPVDFRCCQRTPRSLRRLHGCCCC